MSERERLCYYNRNPNTTDLRLRSNTVFTHSGGPCVRLFVLHNPREIVSTIKCYLTLYVSLLPDINWNRKRKHENKGRRHYDRRKNARFGREILEMLQTEKLYAIHWLTSSGSFAGPGEKLRTRWVVSAMVEQISRVVINKGLRNRSDRVEGSGKRKIQVYSNCFTNLPNIRENTNAASLSQRLRMNGNKHRWLVNTHLHV